MAGSGRSSSLLPLALLSITGIALLLWLMTGGGASKLTPAQVSGTAEAAHFPTAQAARQMTRVVVAATGTALAGSTVTTLAHELEVNSAQTAVAAATEAHATAQAPATQTAKAIEFGIAKAQAEGTATALSGLATLVHGPSMGRLEQGQDNTVACDAAGVTPRDFIVEARFQNPPGSSLRDAAAPQPWDYGIVFSNAGQNTDYRLILDSEGSWDLNLHSEGYDVENLDSTPLLDLSNTGSNLLKLFVTGDKAQLYINNSYIDTLNLNMLGLDEPTQAPRGVSICAGIKSEDALAGRSVDYSGFTVWLLP